MYSSANWIQQELVWAKGYGSSHEDYGYGIAVNSGGNFVSQEIWGVEFVWGHKI